MARLRFEVVGVKPKRWWSRFSGARLIVLQRLHDDPNDWPLFGQIKIDVEDPAAAAEFAAGQVYEMDLRRFDG